MKRKQPIQLGICMTMHQPDRLTRRASSCNCTRHHQLTITRLSHLGVDGKKKKARRHQFAAPDTDRPPGQAWKVDDARRTNGSLDLSTRTPSPADRKPARVGRLSSPHTCPVAKSPSPRFPGSTRHGDLVHRMIPTWALLCQV